MEHGQESTRARATWWLAGIAVAAGAALALQALRQQGENRELRRGLAAAREALAAASAATEEPGIAQPSGAAPPLPAAPVLLPAGTTVQADVAMAAFVADTNAPAQPPEMSEAVAQALASFDRAMDKEFDRLENREAGDIPAPEQDLIARLKAQMLRLDEIRAQADAAPSPDETAALQAELWTTMGRIISLGQAHRRQRLEELARRMGPRTDEEIRAFLDDVDRIYRDTQLDWAELFNRGP